MKYGINFKILISKPLHEKEMPEMKGVGRRRRRTQLLDDLRKRRRCWKIKEKV